MDSPITSTFFAAGLFAFIQDNFERLVKKSAILINISDVEKIQKSREDFNTLLNTPFDIKLV
jgi:hypothetical protein